MVSRWCGGAALSFRGGLFVTAAAGRGSFWRRCGVVTDAGLSGPVAGRRRSAVFDIVTGQMLWKGGGTTEKCPYSARKVIVKSKRKLCTNFLCCWWSDNCMDQHVVQLAGRISSSQSGTLAVSAVR